VEVACARLAVPLSLVLPWLLASVGFVEADEGACARAPEVEQRVRGILGLRPDDELEERARLTREGDQLKVVVRRKDGSLLGEKTLGEGVSCQELEGVVSVVIATWISDLHPEFLATLPAAPSHGVMPSEQAEAPEPAGEPEPRPPLPVGERSSPPPALPERASSPAQRWRLQLAAAAGLSLAGDAAALASLGLRWAPERRGFGAALGAFVTTARDEALSPGRVSYRRWPIALGPLWRVPLADARLDFHVAPALAWLRAEGQDFESSFSRDVLRPAGLLGVRAGYGRGSVSGFLEASGVAWGRTEAFIEKGAEEPAVALPSFELYLTVGASWTP
jgi:hypothetical protein